MMKKTYLSLILAVLLVAGSYVLYQKIFIQPELKTQAYDICFVYLYDKANPSVHPSYGGNYHIKKWQDFEKRFGSSGAKTIDEFCQLYPVDLSGVN